MKGQMSVLSLVMITGIVVSLVGASYFWGVPLIDKQSSGATFQAASSFVLTLNEKIIETANAGGGEGSLDIPLGGITLNPYDPLDADNSNNITFEVPFTEPLALSDSVVYLGGATFADQTMANGTFGESSPSVITFTMEPAGSQYVGVFTIHYRPLEDSPTAYLITLAGSGSGTSTIGWAFSSIDAKPTITLTHMQMDVA